MMNIGEAAALSGVSAKMIRHYESIDLIQHTRRSEAGYRQYDDADLHTLRFIKHSRKLGFSLSQIRELLSLWQNASRTSADVKALAQAHITELDKQILELTQMRDTLHRLSLACAGDQRPDCPILQGLTGEDTSCSSCNSAS